MSISYSPTPLALRVEIKPSNYFRIVLIGVAAVALAATFYAVLIWPLRLLSAILIFAYTSYCWRAQTRQCGMLQWRSMWFWRGADAVECALRLQHCTLWPGLIALTFYDVERVKKFTLTLFADSFLVAGDALRLRVHLHHFPVFEALD